MSEAVGVVRTLRRFPVKSMQGEQVQCVIVGPQGVLGDRCLAIVDAGSGQVITGKTPGMGPKALACRARFTAPVFPDHRLPGVEIELPNGTTLSSDAGHVDEALTCYFGRPVKLASAAPVQAALVQNRSAFLEAAALAPALGPGSLLDLMPVSVLSASTLDRLAEIRPETRFDERRFRMNVVLSSPLQGFAENGWSGCGLQFGDGVRLRVAIQVPRCAVTTMAQDELPRDPAVLRTLARMNSVDVAGRTLPCAGVYATVEVGGVIRADDVVRLVDSGMKCLRDDA